MKKLLVIAAIILALIGGSVWYLMADQEKSQPAAPTPPETITQSATTSQAGKYVDYQESLVATTPGTKVIFFHAPWCPQCRQLETEIQAGPLPENTTIFKADYDTNQALRQKYGVTLQTTLVKVDDQGNLVEKYVSYSDPTLEAIKQNIL